MDDEKYEKKDKAYDRNKPRNIPWRLISDEEKDEIKRKSMERKAEEMMKESKKKDEINAGRQKTQDCWE